jgi:hypothetical protein
VILESFAGLFFFDKAAAWNPNAINDYSGRKFNLTGDINFVSVRLSNVTYRIGNRCKFVWLL